MDEVYFFDLPVYRLSPEDYALAWEKGVAADRERIMGKSNFPISDQVDQSIRHDRYRRYGDWQFNEVVAYIRLYFCGTQLKSAYHSAEKTRNPVTRHKVFNERSRGLSFKLSLGSQSKATNPEIWATIQEFVQACKEIKKDRYIDDSTLMRIGPHMDWLSIWRQR
ncbi:hypothetical protein ASE23_12925 [Rhizobium sp. Root73]|uniref:hypothetical protein n=1 Tax=unclassified Rhizobium TaxID=2613769 RepID=UPI0007269549|nr:MULTISPECIES: hypothetical protein [unclassified Rhizobium]KQY03696.1 hypothetical protein ASD36_15125 [Rhizobium sp. Root1334]KRC00336.1 hypothetical protein ASE23_12925 [Rhizobium sp. Root73]